LIPGSKTKPLKYWQKGQKLLQLLKDRLQRMT
jgi:hypothetical protein